MNNILVRKAKISDIDEIHALCNTLGEQSFSFDHDLSTTWADGKEGTKYYEDRIAGERGICLVAEKDSAIVGFVSSTIHEKDTWRLVKRVEVDNIFIKEAFRGSGIGKLLLDAMKQWGRDIGAGRIFLTAFIKNEKAIAFYQREGLIPYELTLEQKLDK